MTFIAVILGLVGTFYLIEGLTLIMWGCWEILCQLLSFIFRREP